MYRVDVYFLSKTLAEVCIEFKHLHVRSSETFWYSHFTTSDSFFLVGSTIYGDPCHFYNNNVLDGW